MTVGAGALGWVGLRGQRSAGPAGSSSTRPGTMCETRTSGDPPHGPRSLSPTPSSCARRPNAPTRRATEREVAAARRAPAERPADGPSRPPPRCARAANSLRAARATVPHVGTDPAEFPLAKVVAAHDAVLARWMEYETDPAKPIAFPQMSDGRSPVMTGVPARAAASAVSCARHRADAPDDACRLRRLPRRGAAAGAGLRCASASTRPPARHQDVAAPDSGSDRLVQLGRHRSTMRSCGTRSARSHWSADGDDARWPASAVAAARHRRSAEASPRSLIPQRPRTAAPGR